MAVKSSLLGATLVVTLQTGVDDKGAPKLKKRTFANIRAEASDQDLFDTAKALFSLQKYPVISVYRDNRLVLEEE